MLKVLGRANSINVQKVMWCCAELELAVERVDIGGPFGGVCVVRHTVGNTSLCEYAFGRRSGSAGDG